MLLENSFETCSIILRKCPLFHMCSRFKELDKLVFFSKYFASEESMVPSSLDADLFRWPLNGSFTSIFFHYRVLLHDLLPLHGKSDNQPYFSWLGTLHLKTATVWVSECINHGPFILSLLRISFLLYFYLVNSSLSVCRDWW